MIESTAPENVGLSASPDHFNRYVDEGKLPGYLVLIGSVRAFTNRLMAGLILNRERTESWLSRNPILVTALNPIIGYNNGAKVAKAALTEGKTVRQVVLEMGLMEAAELDKVLDT